MAGYNFVANDGKLHTRYSELKRATPGSVERLVAERHGERTSFHSEIMEFGTDRHAMWEDEARATGKLPECFGLDEPVDRIEEEFAAEVFRGIVIHCRPDAVNAAGGVVNDYKTMTAKPGEPLLGSAARRYSLDAQLLVYAYLLSIHGIQITKRRYLVELWNVERDTIIGYDVFEAPVLIKDLVYAKRWLKGKADLLAFAEHMHAEIA